MKTKGQRLKDKAIEIMPEQGWEFVDVTIDSYDVLDDVLYRQSEYIGGMVSVIIKLLKKEDEK